uniref:hypothetical protein n=1 Tax=Flavobacterium sp. TaxID=239 RepID=UPI00404A86B0
MSEEETRDEIIDIVNNNEEPIIEEEVKEEPVKQEEVKPKAKRASRAKPKVKIVKESVEPVVEVVEEPVEVEKPVEKKKVDKLKQIVECPDCNQFMTVHTLKYIHKRRGFCKADVKPEAVPEKTPEPVPVPKPVQQKPKPITEDIVNDYIKQNPDMLIMTLSQVQHYHSFQESINSFHLFPELY